jgi:hypothetical protein
MRNEVIAQALLAHQSNALCILCTAQSRLVFLPTNIDNAHWLLSIVDNERMEIHHYDSMGGTAGFEVSLFG